MYMVCFQYADSFYSDVAISSKLSSSLKILKREHVVSDILPLFGSSLLKIHILQCMEFVFRNSNSIVISLILNDVEIETGVHIENT